MMFSLRLPTVLLALAAPVFCGEWTLQAHAERNGRALASYRAKLDGEYLVVEVKTAEGWHTYAMDNKQRAREALAGKMSLGVEENTRVTVSQGLEVSGPWRQSEPKDFSQPDLRWFTWGFDAPALLAAKVRRTGAGPALVAVRAQICDSVSCQAVDTELELPFPAEVGKTELDIGALTKVRAD